MHIGGTVAIKEWKLYPPDSYFLDTWGNTVHFNGNCTLDPAKLPDPPCHVAPPSDLRASDFTATKSAATLPPQKACNGGKGCAHSTGETCGQVFWIKLAQRLHRLRPSNQSYVAEIERALYNGERENACFPLSLLQVSVPSLSWQIVIALIPFHSHKNSTM
jgi:hypothetical protein